jgi:hypothetical protein
MYIYPTFHNVYPIYFMAHGFCTPTTDSTFILSVVTLGQEIGNTTIVLDHFDTTEGDGLINTLSPTSKFVFNLFRLLSVAVNNCISIDFN